VLTARGGLSINRAKANDCMCTALPSCRSFITHHHSSAFAPYDCDMKWGLLPYLQYYQSLTFTIYLQHSLPKQAKAKAKASHSPIAAPCTRHPWSPASSGVRLTVTRLPHARLSHNSYDVCNPNTMSLTVRKAPSAQSFARDA
jgi:hypothetical protein